MDRNMVDVVNTKPCMVMLYRERNKENPTIRVERDRMLLRMSEIGSYVKYTKRIMCQGSVCLQHRVQTADRSLSLQK
jgi:hypothetical protein